MRLRLGFGGRKVLAASLPANPGPWGELAIGLEREKLAPESIGVATGVQEELDSLVMIDSTGLSRVATVLSVSSKQVRFLAPTGLAAGGAVLVATGVDGTVEYGGVEVGAVAPALFEGVVKGRSVELYGTGIRGRSSLDAVRCTIDGVTVAVVYAGAQGGYPGLDQVNVELPESFGSSGPSTVVLTVDGIAAAPFSLAIL